MVIIRQAFVQASVKYIVIILHVSGIVLFLNLIHKFIFHTLPVEDEDVAPDAQELRVVKPWPWLQSAYQRTPTDDAITLPVRR